VADDLRKLGFDWPVSWVHFPGGGSQLSKNANHNTERGAISAPNQAEARQWLRVKYGCDIFIDEQWIGSDEQLYSYKILYRPKDLRNKKREADRVKRINSYQEPSPGTYEGAWRRYEQAELAAIVKSIEVLRDEQD
jgi:hypothetical protein